MANQQVHGPAVIETASLSTAKPSVCRTFVNWRLSCSVVVACTCSMGTWLRGSTKCLPLQTHELTRLTCRIFGDCYGHPPIKVVPAAGQYIQVIFTAETVACNPGNQLVSLRAAKRASTNQTIQRGLVGQQPYNKCIQRTFDGKGFSPINE